MDPVKKITKVNKKRSRSKSPIRSNKKQEIDPSVKEVPVTKVEKTTVPTVSTEPVSLGMTKRDILVQAPEELMELVPPDLPGEGPLDTLLMKSGSLDKLLGEGDKTWPDLAGKLKEVFLPYQQSLPTVYDKTDPANYVATLGTVYYSSKNSKLVQDPVNSEFLKKGEAAAAVSFVEKFMKANGQWDYILKQEWFTKGEYAIAIDMNYYPDRSGYKDSPVFHKDTGGNNIFVNLVFDNSKPIEATEWFADLAQPSKKRTEWRKDLVPKAYLDDLDISRKTLQKEYGNPDKPVTGGVSEGPHTYVSWVDDLVWHATPTDQPRIVYSAKAAQTSYTMLDKASKGADFAYDSAKFKRKMLGVEILGTIAESKDTALYKWLDQQGLSAQDVDVEVGKRAWRELYSSDKGGKTLFIEDATKREKTPWRITGEYSEASAEDLNLKGSSSIQETPIGLSGRRRANSLDSQTVTKVRKANERVPRSFLRTWVRMLPKDSDELSKSGLVQ